MDSIYFKRRKGLTGDSSNVVSSDSNSKQLARARSAEPPSRSSSIISDVVPTVIVTPSVTPTAAQVDSAPIPSLVNVITIPPLPAPTGRKVVFRTDLDDYKTVINERVDKLAASMDMLTKNIGTMASQILSKSTEIQDLSAKVDDAVKKLDDTKQAAALKEALDALNNCIEQNEANLRDISAELVNHTARLKFLETHFEA